MQVKNEHTKIVYSCVQYCLNVIRYYNGELDGDQGRTKIAIDNFQKACGLDIDGRIGRETWREILRKLAQEIHGKVPSNFNYSKLM